MRNCEEYQALISALIDDDISNEARKELLEHTAVCEACKAYLDDQLAICETLKKLDCPAPADFCDSVMAKVRETKQDAPEKKVIAFPRWKRYAGLAACFAVIVMGLSIIGDAPVNMSRSTDGAAPELFISSTAENAAQAPAAASGAMAPEAKAEEDNGSCVADSSADYSTYAEISEFAARITTGSEKAAHWVEETLGEIWTSGTYYCLTAEEYAALLTLLEDNGEIFTVTAGTGDSEFYQLLAE